MLKQCFAFGLLLAAMLGVVGCAVTQTGLEERAQHTRLYPQAKRTLPLQSNETYDDLLLRVAQRVPTFGGMFFEFEGRQYTGVLYIYLLDPSQKEAATQAIISIFGPLYPDLLPPREARVLPAQYSFLQLKEWFDRMSILHNLPEVTLSDIDDAKNRLTLGLKKMDAEAVSLVEHELARLGIPREAVILEETGPFLEDKLNIAQALDTNRNGFLDDLEILWALDLWIHQAPVPSLGVVITNTQLLELVELWQSRQLLLTEE